jgi:hypothetical protein
MLGHSTITITLDVYSHVTSATQRDARSSNGPVDALIDLDA